jgi:hypothetical protein
MTSKREPARSLTLRRCSGPRSPGSKLADLDLSGDGDPRDRQAAVNALISELGDGGGKKRTACCSAPAAHCGLSERIMVQGRGVAQRADRWGKLFLLTQLSATAIEQAGVAGPIPVRTELDPGDATAMQVNVIITARAADTAD